MAAPLAGFRITGLAELQRALGPGLVAQPARNLFTRGALIVEGNQKRFAPVDRGPLRQSVTHEIDGAFVPTFARIGTNYPTAPYVQFGTRPHWPPPGALAGWARRHGFGPGGDYLVRRKIAKYGTKAQPFLTQGLEASKGQLSTLVPQMARDIEAQAAAGAVRRR